MSSQKDFLKYLGQNTGDPRRFLYPGGDFQQLQSSPGALPPGVKLVQMKKATDGPPPVPPRPHASNPLAGLSANRYAPMSLGYGASPYNMGYNTRGLPYSSLNALGLGNNRYGYYGGADMGSPDNLFIRIAEESSRPAFQSIESLVSAVSSISMMLESTYHAVYSSYRAVLGVVDQFSRLRSHLAHILSTLALIRTLQWLCRKVLHLLGIRPTNPSAEAAWEAATSAAKTGPSSDAADSQAAWPIFMFMGLVFGAPWLIFRIFSKMASKKAEEIIRSSDSQQRQLVALYDFHATHPGELSLTKGQVVIAAPKNLQSKTPGWYLVCTDSQTTGLVPTSYIRRIAKKNTAVSPKVPQEPPPGSELRESSPPEAVSDTCVQNGEQNEISIEKYLGNEEKKDVVGAS